MNYATAQILKVSPDRSQVFIDIVRFDELSGLEEGVWIPIPLNIPSRDRALNGDPIECLLHESIRSYSDLTANPDGLVITGCPERISDQEFEDLGAYFMERGL